MASPLATYDVICRKLSNWPSLNLSHCVRGDERTATKKLQVLTFYRVFFFFFFFFFSGFSIANTRQGAHTPPEGIFTEILTQRCFFSGSTRTEPLIHVLRAQAAQGIYRLLLSPRDNLLF